MSRWGQSAQAGRCSPSCWSARAISAARPWRSVSVARTSRRGSARTPGQFGLSRPGPPRALARTFPLREAADLLALVGDDVEPAGEDLDVRARGLVKALSEARARR